MYEEILTIKRKNYSTLQVDCDQGVAMEIWEQFSFFAPNYKFMPKYRNKIWDGKIRIFNMKAREFPAGLYYHLKKFADERGYKIHFEESEYGLPNEKKDIDVKEIMKFITDLNLHSSGNKIEVRDYQFDAICTALETTRPLLISPTGSGKSLIIYVIMRYLLEQVDGKILIVVPTTSLVDQMYGDFEDYSSEVNWDVSQECHKIYSGKEKTNVHERVFISTWQSIYKLPKTWFKQFNVIFGDEAHGFTAESLKSIMNKAVNAEYRIGTTGTLDGSLTNELVLQGHFGKIRKVTSTRELQDNDTLAKLDINVLQLVYPDDIRSTFGKQTYHSEIGFLIRYEQRNNYIKNLAKKLDGNTLILFQYVEKHGKILYEMIKKACPNRKVFFVAGETETADREAIRKIVEKLKNAIIVASSGVFSTGVNIRNLHNLIFASPSKSQIRVLQSIGRGLRKSDNGVITRLFDIVDDISWGKRKNYAFKHGEHRIMLYTKENFNMKIYRINLK